MRPAARVAALARNDELLKALKAAAYHLDKLWETLTTELHGESRYQAEDVLARLADSVEGTIQYADRLHDRLKGRGF
ncbi:MAG TPA: hypothetical protein VJL28_02095 [Gemmatimonadaceae bacterium]|nr:hypothetical protein [Gemmatimonadaceae bacterium]